MKRRSRSGVHGRRGSVAPLGLGSHRRRPPTADAVGYCLSALRAWGHGLGGREGAEVCRDRTRFFPMGLRYRCRYRRVWRGVAGRVRRPRWACRIGRLRRMGTASFFRRLAIFAAILLGLRPRGRTRRREDAKTRSGKGTDWGHVLGNRAWFGFVSWVGFVTWWWPQPRCG
jgi:hypothetical protein